MSAYQYFEFQAADRRPITEREMATLRGLSSRATIIPTRFVKLAGRGRERPEPRATVRAAQHLLLPTPRRANLDKLVDSSGGESRRLRRSKSFDRVTDHGSEECG